MIEYLYDAIRATAGEDITISAKLTEDDGTPIENVCRVRLYDDKEMIYYAPGNLIDNIWYFTIPGEITEGLSGRYWYAICQDGLTISFKQPLYLV